MDRQQMGFFTRISRWTAIAAGQPVTFVLAVITVVVWAVTGPFFGYSNTWQLIVNTYTDIVIFLMVFMIQNTQNRNNQTIQIKLNDLIRAVHGAHTVLLDVEELSDDELGRLHAEYIALASKARELMRRGRSDTGQDEIQIT